MNTARLIRQSLRSMGRYKWRTGFMMLGSLIGVAGLSFALSLGQTVQTKMLETVRQVLGDGSILVAGGGGMMMGSHRAASTRLTLDDMATVAREVPNVEDWDPQAELSGLTVRHDDATATARVLGQSERWERVWSRGVSRGESFGAAQVAGTARVAVIGETVARALFGGEDPVNAEIRIGAVPFRVIGVLERYGVDLHGMDRDNEIVVPITTLMRRLTNADAIGAARLVLKDPSRSEETADRIRQALRTRHGLNRDQPDDFRILTPVEVQSMVGFVRRILLLYIPLVGAVVLVVGGIVAATLMLASVSERTGEIGLRRAVGALPEDIRRQFLVETFTTVLAGGVGGLVIGYLGVQLLAMHLPVGGGFSWSAVLISLVASSLVGLAAGVAPARRAARLQPAAALR